MRAFSIESGVFRATCTHMLAVDYSEGAETVGNVFAAIYPVNRVNPLSV